MRVRKGSMGRQKQRAKQRRNQSASGASAQPASKARQQSTASSDSGLGRVPVIAGIILLLAVVGGLAALALRGGSTNGDSPTPIPTASTASSPSLAPRIDGIPCVQEMLNYHVHSPLSINAAGKPVTVPANVGIKIGNSFSCLYWLHTHDSSGLIHVEAPHVIHPTLGQFFDVWGQMLSRTQVAGAL